jgi:prevent-host-death family protein
MEERMANQRIEVAEARLAELVAAVQGGDEVVLTHDGQPVARLLPARTTVALVGITGPRKAGSARGLVFIRDDFDDPLEGFRDYI